MSGPLPFVRAWLGNGPSVAPPAAPQARRRLLDEAADEGVDGIVLQRFLQAAPGDASLKPRVSRLFRAGAAHAAFLDGLAAREVEAIVLKGGSLASTVYGGQPSLRPLSDLDLLVRPADEAAARAAVEALWSEGRREVVVDWHADLLGARRVPSRARLCGLSTEVLFDRSLPLRGRLRRLPPELELVFLALHGFKHSFCRLIWLVDLALVHRTCDVARLRAVAREVGAERPVVVALHLLSRILAEPVRPWARLAWHEALCARLAGWRGVGHNLAWGEVMLALSVDGWRARARYLRELLLPPPSDPLSLLRRLRRFVLSRDRTRG